VRARRARRGGRRRALPLGVTALVAVACGTGDGGGGGGARDPAATTLANGITCTSAAADPDSAKAIGDWLDALPYGNPTGDARAEIVEAVLRTCQVFAPAGLPKRRCWAHLASAMLKESSYDAAVVVTDDYAKRSVEGRDADDPTVGLLQIRFSATVHDVAEFAPEGALACIGCPLPEEVRVRVGEPGDSAFWAVTGPTTYRSLLTRRACNIAMGAWYYYVNATGNGDPGKPTYAADYCGGRGTAANLVTGLRSHLLGPDGANGVVRDAAAFEALRATDAGSYEYVSEIKARFDAMIGPTSGTHPFFEPLVPEPARYCR
jgi:hypothetical protein